MKFPLKIFDVQYQVYLDDEEAFEKACEQYDIDPKITQGLHLDMTRRIYVTSKVPPEEQAQTLLHELLHAIGTICGHAKLAVETQANELLVNAVATGLAQALSNPTLYKVLGEKLGVFREEAKHD